MIDAEKLLLGWAKDGRFAPTRVVSERPAEFTRLIFIKRTGGPAQFVMDHPSVTLECFDATLEDARELAVLVANGLLDMRGYRATGGTVTDVSVGSGPFWLDWENKNVRRFGIAAQLTIR